MSPGNREFLGIRVCYFLSGALGLIYQVLWLRKLTLIFGSSVFAVSTVLTVFFIGLALGSFWFGQWIDRCPRLGLRVYAWLEIIIGVYAFISPGLFSAVSRTSLYFWQAADYTPMALIFAALIGAAIVLILPTALLGGTFSVLNRFFIDEPTHRGKHIAELYALNTAGAVAGTLLIYFFALPFIGWQLSLICAGVLNIGIGLLCLVYDRILDATQFRAEDPVAVPVAASQKESAQAGWGYLGLFLSGFAALAYEVSWTRALSLVLGNSIYAFCLMLSTFLTGIALGSWRARRHLKKSEPDLQRIARIQWLLAALGLGSIALFSYLPYWFVRAWPVFGDSFNSLIFLQLVLSAAVMLVPAYLFGYLFPLVGAWATEYVSVLGRRLGSVFAVNTIGGALGAFLCGFLLIPVIGLPWAIASAALMNLLSGIAFLFEKFRGISWGRNAITEAALVGGVVLMLGTQCAVPAWDQQSLAQGVYSAPDFFLKDSSLGDSDSQMLFYKDSWNTTVSVHQDTAGTLSLKIGGKTDASNGLDMATQLLSGHLPLLLHSDAQKVLVIGLGSGVTLGAAGLHPVQQLDAVEIDPAVAEAAERFFAKENLNVLQDPRTRLLIADGRHYLEATETQYDVVISEPSNPWIAGMGYLFTNEYYQLVKKRLAPDGVMCQWIQLYGIFPQDLKLVLNTFGQNFSHVLAFSSMPGDLLLIGANRPLRFDYAELKEILTQAAIKENLSPIRADDPDRLLAYFLWGNPSLDEITSEVDWVHSDDLPWLEFNTPKALYVGGLIDSNYRGLLRFREEVSNYVIGLPSGWPRSDTLRDWARIWAERSEIGRALESYEQIQRKPEALTPEDKFQMAVAYERLGFYLNASDLYRQILDAEPDDARVYHRLAGLSLRERDVADAVAWYELANARNIDLSPWLGDIGLVYSQHRRHNEALRYFRAALGNETLGLEHMSGYYDSLVETGLWGELEEVLIAMSERSNKNSADWHYYQGMLLVSAGDAEAAIISFQESLRLEPRHADTYYQMALVYRDQGLYASALEALRDALALDPYYRKAAKAIKHLQPQ